MQDIRPELRDRLKAVQDESQQLRQKLSNLEEVERGLKTVLESETSLWNRLSPPPLFQQAADNVSSNNGSATLPALLEEFLRDGNEWTIDQFRAELNKRGYPFGDKAPGRVINFALVGMANHAIVENLGDGRWKLK